jgi:hypothetical protein
MASSSEGEELSPQKIKKRLVNRNYKLKKSVENNTSRASDSSLNGRDSLKGFNFYFFFIPFAQKLLYPSCMAFIIKTLTATL